jgi:hypothetical protein
VWKTHFEGKNVENFSVERACFAALGGKWRTTFCPQTKKHLCKKFLPKKRVFDFLLVYFILK